MSLRYILLLLPVSFAIIFAVYGGKTSASSDFEAAREIVVLREIGHKLLLSAGDRSTRVLPVKKVSNNRFEIHFERELSIVPDSFVTIVTKNLRDKLFLSNYTANLVSCKRKEIVYAFATSPDSTSNIVPCLERLLPMGCYYAEIIFDIPGRSRNQFYWPIIIFAVALPIALFFLWTKFKRKEKLSGSTKQPHSNGAIQIGTYEFFYSQQHLFREGQRIELTRKESDLLFMLASHPNDVVEREVLQKKIWEDEGVIVTRSLDMFVSRLRKKLANDPGIKIVNVHKKGYKLELSMSA
jgi:DNA-binding winged helix-turn-helix (wHTH) protein